MKIQFVKRPLVWSLCLMLFFLFVTKLSATNAPVVRIGSVSNAVKGELVAIPLYVTGFENIGGFTLAFDYEKAKLDFISGDFNSHFTGTCHTGDIDLGNGYHRITISWYCTADTGISLADQTILAKFTFRFNSGPVFLNWFDSGASCSYVDPFAKVLNDVPLHKFYINGVVSDKKAVKPLITVHGETTFNEGGKVSLSSSYGFSYLWSTGDTSSSLNVYKSGRYAVQTIDAAGQLSEPSDTIVVSVIPIGSNQLGFRLWNPRVTNDGVNNFFEFDVQIKADVTGSYFYRGQICLNYNNLSLSSKLANWTIIPGFNFTASNSKANLGYTMGLSISRSMLSVKLEGDAGTNNAKSLSDLVAITMDYQTIITVKSVLLSHSGITGVGFNQGMMNGQLYYRTSEFPGYRSYKLVNSYGEDDFYDISHLLTETANELFNLQSQVYVVRNQRIIINGNIGVGAFVRIFDMKGNLHHYEKLNSGSNNEITGFELHLGMYLLVIYDENKIRSYKVLLGS